MTYTQELSCKSDALINSRMFVAACIARQYAHRLPTVTELRARFGMSRATAYRWRKAFELAGARSA